MQLPPEAVPLRGRPDHAITPDGTVWRLTAPEGRGRWGAEKYPRIVKHVLLGSKGRRSKYVRFHFSGRAHSVAAMVLDSFGPPRPLSKSARASYLDGDQMNAHISNLAWGRMDGVAKTGYQKPTAGVDPTFPPAQAAPVVPPAGAAGPQ